MSIKTELHQVNVRKKYTFRRPFTIGENPCSKIVRNYYTQIHDAFSVMINEGQNRGFFN